MVVVYYISPCNSNSYNINNNWSLKMSDEKRIVIAVIILLIIYLILRAKGILP